ncbi:MAG: hypothetical protein V2A72_00905 [Candidatus Omnitrophota bacterium]
MKKTASILLVTLWALSLLSAFALILGYQVRQRTTLVYRLNDKAKLRAIAEAGVKYAHSKIRADRNSEGAEAASYDCLRSDWSDNAAQFKNVRLGDGTFSISYNYVDKKTRSIKTRYGLIDEERKINLNKASRPMIQKLFKSVLGLEETQAQELAASIIDWQDGDGNLSIPIGSAEDSYYRYLSHPYEAKDGDFEALEEVLLVKGMTNEIFDRVRDYITVYGEGKMNINTAPAAVLYSLGLNNDVVQKILAFRCGADKLEGTEDDFVFESSEGIVLTLSQVFNLGDFEAAQLTAAVSEKDLVVYSENFTIQCNAKLNNKKSKMRILCVVDKKGKVLYWQES